MQFSTFEYFSFLATAVAVYWLFGRFLPRAGRVAMLVLASLVFYGWSAPQCLLFLILSIVINYPIAAQLRKRRGQRGLTAFAVVLNCLPLLFFKYTNFILGVASSAVGLCGGSWTWAPMKLVLPLGISYVTFVQIAYVVDASRGSPSVSFLDYALHVSFWPKLISGPIVRQREIVPQLNKQKFGRLCALRWCVGLTVFMIGLAKKLLLADPLGGVADWGWGAGTVNCASAWLTTACYTLQLYFDFSGYCDMAWGSAIFFNIKLPINFRSPYKADSIQDFWRRWHISLSLWLRDYLYFSFGGSRCALPKTIRNVFLTFLIGGIWHGAGWTFIIWGALHGLALSICNLWRKLQPRRLPRPIGWLLTILFVHFAWIFFRAPDAAAACRMIGAMFAPAATGAKSFDWTFSQSYFFYAMALVSVLVLFARNTYQMTVFLLLRTRSVKWQILSGGYAAFLLFCCILRMCARNVPQSPFLYFQF